jgi:hypothetical protein
MRLLTGPNQEPAKRAWSFSPRRVSRGIGGEPKFRPSSPVRGDISLGHLAGHRKPMPPLPGLGVLFGAWPASHGWLAVG